MVLKIPSGQQSRPVLFAGYRSPEVQLFFHSRFPLSLDGLIYRIPPILNRTATYVFHGYDMDDPPAYEGM
jgi:hypothetical protein